MRRSLSAALLLVGSPLCLACAPSIVSSAPAATTATVESRQRHRLSHEEILKSGHQSTLQAIRLLRPAEVSGGTLGMGALAVFMDGSSIDVGLSALAEVPVEVVCEVRFLHGPEAEIRFGRQRAIVVSTSADGGCRTES